MKIEALRTLADAAGADGIPVPDACLEWARQAERERIARELHDTLLQSVHALILQVDAIAQQFPPEAPMRVSLEHILDKARATSREARDLVQGLRVQSDDEVDLRLRLRAAVERACVEFGRHCVVAAKGSPFPVPAQDADSCCRVAVEGLRNAFRHAQAANVVLELDYGTHALRLSVSDDGVGMGAPVTKPAPPQHWGIRGMHERAAKAGASLQIRSAPGQGTRLTLELPRPYARHREQIN